MVDRKDERWGGPCPVCSWRGVEVVGPIFHKQPLEVAGIPVALEPVRFQLLCCPRCRFQYKKPPICQEMLSDCYRRASASHWEDNPDGRVRRFDVICQVLTRHAPGRRVVDIGCFNGALLHYLGPQWQRFGIEPGEAAAAATHQRGIEVLGGSVDDVPGDSPAFDCALAIDIVEHIQEPVPFFRKIHRLLRARGIVVILTGNTQAWTWRMHGSRYWYCSLVEHLSFYSETTLRYLAELCGFQVIECHRLSHIRPTAGRLIREMFTNALYLAGRSVRSLGLAHLRELMVHRHMPRWISSPDQPVHKLIGVFAVNEYAPAWISSPDHLLVVMRVAGDEEAEAGLAARKSSRASG